MSVEVTVVIPAYNAACYVDKAIESVLTQTVSCHILVINDASSDETLSVAKHYAKEYPGQICVINNETNIGVAASRNCAVSQAKTEYIAFLDADDWWSTDKLELQLKKLRESRADVCYSGRELMTTAGKSTGKIVHVPEQTDYHRLLKGNVVPCSSVVMRREEALKYPMAHDELHEDYIVWLSMLRDGKQFVGIDQPLLKSRLGEDGKSRNKLKSAKMTYGVYRYMGIPVWKAIFYFMCYAAAGVAKYAGRKNEIRSQGGNDGKE